MGWKLHNAGVEKIHKKEVTINDAVMFLEYFEFVSVKFLFVRILRYL